MLTVTTAATSQDLATLETVKAALGISGAAEDATLPELITRASAAIAAACNRVMVQETVEESVRSTGRPGIVLERYPVTSITAITEDGTALVPADYQVDSGSGIIDRLHSDSVACWARGRSVIRYVAGYSLDTMPPDIVQALIMLVAQYRSQGTRDPLLKAAEIPGIERLEYFIPTDAGMPGPVQALLAGHRRPAGA